MGDWRLLPNEDSLSSQAIRFRAAFTESRSGSERLLSGSEFSSLMESSLGVGQFLFDFYVCAARSLCLISSPSRLLWRRTLYPFIAAPDRKRGHGSRSGAIRWARKPVSVYGLSACLSENPPLGSPCP